MISNIIYKYVYINIHMLFSLKFETELYKAELEKPN